MLSFRLFADIKRMKIVLRILQLNFILFWEFGTATITRSFAVFGLNSWYNNLFIEDEYIDVQCICVHLWATRRVALTRSPCFRYGDNRISSIKSESINLWKEINKDAVFDRMRFFMVLSNLIDQQSFRIKFFARIKIVDLPYDKFFHSLYFLTEHFHFSCSRKSGESTWYLRFLQYFTITIIYCTDNFITNYSRNKYDFINSKKYIFLYLWFLFLKIVIIRYLPFEKNHKSTI